MAAGTITIIKGDLGHILYLDESRASAELRRLT